MNYVDYSQEEEVDSATLPSSRNVEPVPSFPVILHVVLECAEREGHDDAISWQPHGRAFCVRDPDKLTEKVLKL